VTGRHVVLVGMMGSGKSTVGALVASRCGRRFVDVDVELEARAGRVIRQLFAEEGEAAFRRRETKLLEELLESHQPLVLATGGGVVLAERNRHLLRGAARVVWLAAEPELLAARVGSDPSRPLLAGGDPLATLRGLCREREPAYRAASDQSVDAGRGLPEQVAERVLIALADAGAPPEVECVTVPLEARGYDVFVGPRARRLLAEVLPPDTRRVAVVSQTGIPVEVDPGREHRSFLLGEGEAAKTLHGVEELCRRWASWGLTRADVVVGVGGGVVTDVAGFAAAVYHRGLPVVHVPTTLLGQVDAAIGGKTGVNLPEGKNLVGAFWQPSAVLCDTDTLASLPEREYRSGLGELAKYHFLGGADLGGLPLPQRVARSVAIKAAVVAADEREGAATATVGGPPLPGDGASPSRDVLNYGHTLAHALEIAGAFDLRHGEAVAIGLVFAAELAAELGRIDAARVAEHRRVVAGYGLPDRLPSGAEPEQLVQLMGRDKKARLGLTFVLDGPRGVEPVTGVPRQALDRAFTALDAGGPSA
jgi:5-deoxy-5-amino-3-dehydroquinate synthase